MAAKIPNTTVQFLEGIAAQLTLPWRRYLEQLPGSSSGSQGPPGPQGPIGPAGPQGPSGGDSIGVLGLVDLAKAASAGSGSGGGAGTVTSVATGTGLTGGTITTSGTISLASIANNDLLANISGSSAAPIPNTLSALIDSAIGSTQGDILYRDSSLWKVLAPGTANNVLITGGSSANPSWDGLSALLDSVFGSAQGDILYRGSSLWTVLTPGTSGNFLQTLGASSNPQWASATGGGGGQGAMVLISTQTLGSAVSAVTFSSISASYKDLVLVCEFTGSASATNVSAGVTFNGDTASHYAYAYASISGSSVGGVSSGGLTTSITTNAIIGATGPSGYQGDMWMYMHNYAGTSFNKTGNFTASTLSGAPAAGTSFCFQGSFWWNQTSAISSLTYTTASGNFAVGSRFSLYGIYG